VPRAVLENAVVLENVVLSVKTPKTAMQEHVLATVSTTVVAEWDVGKPAQITMTVLQSLFNAQLAVLAAALTLEAVELIV